jgi:hypothetical protein
MKKYAHVAAAVGALASAAFGLAPFAAAAPSNSSSVQDTVDRLQALGYNVQLNGSKTAPLNQCTVLAVRPDDPGTTAPKQFTTIWVDISCPPTNN